MFKRYLFICALMAVALCLVADPADAQIRKLNPQAAPAALTSQELEGMDLFGGRAIQLDASKIRSGESFSMKVSLDKQNYTLDLFPKNLRSENFTVEIQIADGSYVEVEPPAPMTFHGHVRGLPNSYATASVVGGKLNAMILLGEVDTELFFIQPRDNGRGYIEYNSLEVIDDGRWTDGHLPNPLMSAEEYHDDGPPPLGPPTGDHYLTEVAFDADYEMFQKNGSDLNDTIADMESIMNAVTIIYERDCQITWEITHIIVRTAEPDPYSKTNAEGILNQFWTQWKNNHTNIHRDVAHLFTGKNVDGSTIGLAWVKVICANLSYGFGYAMVESRFSTNYKQRVALSAHEIGHNYGCNGHCDGDGDCHIMCSAVNSCNGIGMPHFGPWAQGKIVSYADTRACLDIVDATYAVNMDANIGANEIVIEVSPPDINNETDGTIPLIRKYPDGTNVTIEAPKEYYLGALLYRFLKWTLDGVDQPDYQEQISFTANFNQADAEYVLAKNLAISSKPEIGVVITGTPTDFDGLTDGNTPFELVYASGDNITLEAPLAKANYTFDCWSINGVDQPTGQTSVVVNIPYFGNPKAVAKYNADYTPFLPAWLKSLLNWDNSIFQIP